MKVGLGRMFSNSYRINYEFLKLEVHNLAEATRAVSTTKVHMAMVVGLPPTDSSFTTGIRANITLFFLLLLKLE